LIRFERTHRLADLLGLCIPVDKDFRKLASDLNSLDGFAVAIRYPGATVSADLAEDAFEAAKRVRVFVRSKLKLK
ncbi:MAG: HEPN domain-containing protein, partial [Anaerolineales bacterium]|nr:HEPN domain-containing protein [Anaerolineales bacterium]